MTIGDCTILVAPRGKRVHAMANDAPGVTLCGRRAPSWTVTDAIPDCPGCLRKLTCR